ncbi:acyl carrier protein [Salipiger bermudensis]|uniref:acyl carrier protein n=1 Tax=Salipiger bermudensis TaxID=344736 RepID=UPI001C993436|nr:acyl carrier protein [Salipiger bermudensis]MBY6006067.1 acyl carrier protein [Salipiger bermudensis]
MIQTALTLEKMRSDIAAALDIPAAEVPDDAHLGDLGLDSIALMRLLMGWEELQPSLPSGKLYECETLAEFWAAAQAEA